MTRVSDLKKFAAASLFSLSVGAFAHGTKVEATLHGVQSAIEVFKSAETKEVQETFTGVKGWPSGSNIKVKVYLTGDKTLDYVCTEDHSGHHEVMTCVKSQ